jgi:hypothetical protein
MFPSSYSTPTTISVASSLSCPPLCRSTACMSLAHVVLIVGDQRARLWRVFEAHGAAHTHHKRLRWLASSLPHRNCTRS